jgi:hypothetical protein
MRSTVIQALENRIDVLSIRTGIDVESLRADFIFGGIMLAVALIATATCGVDLRFGFF